MERETVVKQIAEEVVLEFNSYHDAQGRFTSKDKAGGAVRDFNPRMAHGLRAGQTARVAGAIRVNGKVLRNAVIGMAANGNRFIRGEDERGRMRHMNLGVVGKTKMGAPRKARDSEVLSVDKARQQNRPIPMDRWNNPAPNPKPAPPPIPQQGPVTVKPVSVPGRSGGADAGTSPLLTSKIQSSKQLGRGERGVNETHILTFEDESRAVWKPMPEWRSDYRKEAVAYDVAKTLGMEHLVPETVVRTIDGRIGSVQRFVENAKVAGKLMDEKEMYDGEADLQRSAAFDYLINHTDRHDFNWMVDSGGSLHLIDHGYSMWENERTYSALLNRAKDQHMTLERIQGEWANKWSNLEAAFRKRQFGEKDINGAKGRYFKLMRVTKFSEL